MLFLPPSVNKCHHTAIKKKSIVETCNVLSMPASVKAFVIVFIVMVCSLDGLSQELGLTAGYATFAMRDMKDINSNTLKSPSVPLKLTSNFPPYTIFGIHGLFPVNSYNTVELGFFASLTSTGSRLAYADYSGYVHLDQKLTGTSLGFLSSFTLAHAMMYKFTFDMKLGATLTNYSINEDSAVGTDHTSDDISFKSTDFFVEPGISYRKKLGRSPLSLFCSAGYYISAVKGKVTLDSDNNAYLQTASGDQAHVDWSGVRISAGINFHLTANEY